MGTGRKNLARLEGISWHKEFLHKKEDDPRRHKYRCIYYRVDGSCRYRLDQCTGSSHCTHYKDAIIEAEKKAYKEKKISWQALSSATIVQNLVQIKDTVELQDTKNGERFQITLENLTEAPELHNVCLGKAIDDRVSVNEFTYQIIQIKKTNGSVYTSSEYNLNIATKQTASSNTSTLPSPKTFSNASIAEILAKNYHKDSGIMKREQIDEADYVNWAQTMVALFKCCKELQSQKDLPFAELRTLPECAEVYKLMSNLLNMIGKVNGYPIRNNTDLHALLMSYAFKPPSEEEIHSAGRRKGKDIFRLRTERYLARRIIEQQSKSPKMLGDDQYDLHLIHNLKTNFRRYKRRKLEKEISH